MQLDQLWPKTCALFASRVSEDVAETWLTQLQPVSISTGPAPVLVLTGDDRARGWIELRYLRPLVDCASSVFGDPLSIELVDEKQVDVVGRQDTVQSSVHFEPKTLNPRYTFSQFVIGNSNHVAHAAALAVAEQPAQAFNPLFLYGAPGVGKTHLLHAIANYLKVQAPELKSAYLTAEDFASLFRSTVLDGTIGEFKRALRGTDVLLVDDVQFLQNKVKTEEEFFHTFNTLHETGRQLVITCDRVPRQLEDIADRLRERFESGLVVELEPPDARLRRAIVGKRVQVDNVPIDDDLALDRIAMRSPANVRSLEGALIRVSAYASMRGEPVTSSLVDELLDAVAPDTPKCSDNPMPPLGKPLEISADDVIDVVTEHFELSRDQLLGKDRSRIVSGPRQIAMYLCCRITDQTLPQIAREFDRDHSTVVHARDKVRKMSRTDETTASTLDSLETRIRLHSARYRKHSAGGNSVVDNVDHQEAASSAVHSTHIR